jgi:hypothetical protein
MGTPEPPRTRIFMGELDLLLRVSRVHLPDLDSHCEIPHRQICLRYCVRPLYLFLFLKATDPITSTELTDFNIQNGLGHNPHAPRCHA